MRFLLLSAGCAYIVDRLEQLWVDVAIVLGSRHTTNVGTCGYDGLLEAVA